MPLLLLLRHNTPWFLMRYLYQLSATYDDFLAFEQSYAKLLDLITHIFPSIYADLAAFQWNVNQFRMDIEYIFFDFTLFDGHFFVILGNFDAFSYSPHDQFFFRVSTFCLDNYSFFVSAPTEKCSMADMCGHTFSLKRTHWIEDILFRSVPSNTTLSTSTPSSLDNSLLKIN